MDNLTRQLFMNTVKVAIIAVFCALSVGTDYALIGVPQVKLMDLIVFVGGFLFGAVVGSSIGVLSWLIYGSINPVGFEPRVWLATMLAESLYGITGALVRSALGSTSLGSQRLRLAVLFAAMGFLPTVVYDVVTNVVYASVYNVPVVIAVFVTGAPFAVLHEVCNFLIFGALSVPAIVAVGKVVRGWQKTP